MALTPRILPGAFESKAVDLEDYLKAFPCLDGQRGMLALINGEAVGMDALSLSPAYEVLHPKLLKSYAMEALLSNGKRAPRASRKKAEVKIKSAWLSGVPLLFMRTKTSATCSSGTENDSPFFPSHWSFLNPIATPPVSFLW